LHSAENPSIHEVATKDVVVASTSLFQQTGGCKTNGAALMRFLKRIHWHRCILDEAHSSLSPAISASIASLSTTHRVSVTGTPIGSQLADLQGQLSFLRLAPFDRPAFWKNNIKDPYYERNTESLRVLRSLLSRVVVRHSKEQTFANGKTLLALPPRTVETVLLDFGSEAGRTCMRVFRAIIGPTT
jgi:SNF2 family DNA or RNA helicase